MSDHEDGEAPLGLEGSRFKVIETEGDVFADAPDGAVLVHAVNCQGQWGSGIAKAFKTKYPVAFEIYKSHCSREERLRKQLVGTSLLIPPQAQDYGMLPPAPLPEDDDESGARRKRRKVTAKVPVSVTRQKKKKHWIACLFTSYGYGKRTKFKPGKDPPDEILGNTEAALRDLRAQVVGSRLDAGTGRIDPDPTRRAAAVGGEDAEGAGGEGADTKNATHEGRHTTREARRVADLPGPLYACKFNSGSFGVEWKDTRALVEQAFEGSTVRVMYVVSPPPPTGK